jgi:hypothetical protein
LLVVSFGGFGYFADVLAGRIGVDQYVVAPWLFLALEAIVVALAFWLMRSPARYEGASRFVLCMSVLLTCYAGGQVAWQTLRGEGKPAEPAPFSPGTVRLGPRLPDIYVVIVDKYTGSRELARLYDFDNSAFEDTLRARGFTVPTRPRANYVHTFLALASMLNLRYLDELPASLGVETRNRRPVDPLIERNEVMAALKARGYRTVFFPTSYPATRRNRFADLQIPSPDRVRPEFVTGWLRTTPIPLLVEVTCLLLGCEAAPIRYAPESADFIEWKLAQLERLPSGSQPVFAFFHLMVPHEPFIYEKDCAHRTPYWPPTDRETMSPWVKKAYTDQVQCVNQKLLRLVTVLQERSSNPPVILLQADHGHGRLGRVIPPYENVSPEQRAERASVFAAYLLPGAPPDALPDDVTPINAMRFVFRHFFDQDLPPLEDVTYWSSAAQPYRLVRLPHLPTSDGAGADGGLTNQP